MRVRASVGKLAVMPASTKRRSQPWRSWPRALSNGRSSHPKIRKPPTDVGSRTPGHCPGHSKRQARRLECFNLDRSQMLLTVISSLMERPSPVPSSAGLVVKSGSYSPPKPCESEVTKKLIRNDSSHRHG